MGYNRLTYIISEGFKNVMKNKKSSMTSLITMIGTMFLFGVFFLLGENINDILKQVQETQGIQVFIKAEATDEQIKQLKDDIFDIGGINTCDFVTKQQALDSIKESFTEAKTVFAGYEDASEIFPDSYVVTLTDLSQAENIQKKIESMEIVDDVTSSNKTINTLIGIARGIKFTIGVFFILLLVIAVAIITNTIKLTVYARRREISIMKYVGATNSFIRWPFMIEGILIGTAAAGVTILILSVLYTSIVSKISGDAVFSTLELSLLQFSDMAQSIVIVFLILGIGIGVIGSRISMKKYLEV